MEGTVLVIPKHSPPRTELGGTRKEVNIISEFTFDLQRFAEHTVSNASELQTKLGSASTGDTIKLSADISDLSVDGNYLAIGSISEANKKLTLDLNGHSLSGTAALDVHCDFTLTDTSSGTAGSFTNTTGHGVWINSGATFTLANGTLNGSSRGCW